MGTQAPRDGGQNAVDGSAKSAAARGRSADRAVLAACLRALASEPRLALLERLAAPRTLDECMGDLDRAEARAHLLSLVAVGLVRVRRAEEDGRVVARYEARHTHLFAVQEELRRVAPAWTPPGGAVSTRRRGPALVLAHGAGEGRAFPLDRATAPDDRWVIGRRAGLAVSLAYDPYVSAEHAVITRRKGAHTLADHHASRHGTRVNGELLRQGERPVLRPGDILGVGRSLLVYVPG